MPARLLGWMVVLGTCAACGGGPPAPLVRAAGAGDVREVRALLAQGADPREVDDALVAAARGGRLDVMRAVIKSGVDVNRRRRNNWTPLVHAIHKRQDAAARLLLDSGARPDETLDGGTTPLMFAAAYGETAIVEELLSRGADPHRRAATGVTALGNAAGGGRFFDITDGPPFGSCSLDTVKALLRHSPDLKMPDNMWTRAARLLGRSEECAQTFSLLEARPRS